MKLKCVYPFLVLVLLSCRDKDIAVVLAQDYCDCCDDAMNGNYRYAERYYKFHICYGNLLISIDQQTGKKLDQYLLRQQVYDIISERRPGYLYYKQHFTEVRETSDDLLVNPGKCRAAFGEGLFDAGNFIEPVFVTRKDSKHLITYVESNFKTLYKVIWIDDCSHYMILESTTRPDQMKRIGDTSFIKIIEVRGDTIDIDVTRKDSHYPQLFIKIHERVNNQK